MWILQYQYEKAERVKTFSLLITACFQPEYRKDDLDRLQVWWEAKGWIDGARGTLSKVLRNDRQDRENSTRVRQI